METKTDKSDAGRCFCSAVNRGQRTLSLAFPVFTPSAKHDTVSKPIQPPEQLLCQYAWITERPSRARGARERGSRGGGEELQGWREDGVRCGGMRTHGEVLLQRVSTLLLQVDRKEVGCGCDSDGKSAHTHTHGQGDTETSACETMRT